MNALEDAIAGVLVKHGLRKDRNGQWRLVGGGDKLITDLGDAVHDLLGRGHTVVVTDDSGGWVIEHSLECRLGGRMADCDYTRWLHSGWVPYKTGRYKPVWMADGDLDFEPLDG